MDEKIELLLYGQQYKKFQEAFYGDLMVQYHLNVIDIRVLLFFYEHKKWDTAKDIVQKHFLTKSYVSKAVDKLIEKGYLERRYYKEDRRYIHLVVQEKAVPVIKLIQEKRKEMVCRLLSGVATEDMELLGKIALQINENISEVLAQKEMAESND